MSRKEPQALPMLSYMTGLLNVLSETVVTDLSSEILNFDESASQVLTCFQECHQRGSKIIFVGNGGSAGITSHMAVDYNKNVGLRALSMNDGAMLTCLGNDYGYDHVFEKQIEFLGVAGDVLVAISSSGNSANILNAVDAARNKNMQVITLSGFSSDNKLRKTGDYNFFISSERYGYVELAHLTICHAIADMAGEWRP